MSTISGEDVDNIFLEWTTEDMKQTEAKIEMNLVANEGSVDFAVRLCKSKVVKKCMVDGWKDYQQSI